MQAAQDTFISSTFWTEGVGPTAARATLAVMDEIDVPAHVARIAMPLREGLVALGGKNHVPIHVGGYPALTSLTFEHPEAAALTTLFTVRMLARGFLAGSTFYPTLAHELRHVDEYLAAVAEVFPEMAEALRCGNVADQIGGPVKHSGFARLT
jgi:glutamate-1-semialdehyde 2,1-aminomutase